MAESPARTTAVRIPTGIPRIRHEQKVHHMDVSVIIVNYKTSQLLVQAIDSILGKTEDIVYEIIVVDNHSQDDSERVVHERYGNRVTYLPLAENVGFGRANNEGLRIARGRNVLFLNPDTILVKQRRPHTERLSRQPSRHGSRRRQSVYGRHAAQRFVQSCPSLDFRRNGSGNAPFAIPIALRPKRIVQPYGIIRLKSVSSQAPT